MRKIFGVLALCGLFGFSAPAYSQIHIRVHLTPPAVRVETLPARPVPTAVWTPGYYRFDEPTRAYIWVPGTWQIPPSRQVIWVAPRYVRLPDGTYNYFSGHWATRHRADEEREAQEKLER